MVRFIGIGSDHHTDVYTEVNGILRKEKPTKVSLEHQVRIWNPMESFPDNATRMEERKAELREGLEIEVISKNRRDTILKAGDIYLYGFPRTNRGSVPEWNAGLHYGIDNDIPIYFVEFNSSFPDAILEIKGGVARAISIEGRTTYQDHPDEFLEGPNGGVIITIEYVDARNRFTSDVINYLLESDDKFVHIGGTNHFRSGHGGDGIPPLTEGLELQNLVRSDEKVVYDAVRRTMTEC